jgi:sulfide:quinone oxidoreductase
MAAQLFPLAPELSIAGRLDRPDIDALTAAGVPTILNNRPDGEDPGQLSAARQSVSPRHMGIAYHLIPITVATLLRADVDAFCCGVARYTRAGRGALPERHPFGAAVGFGRMREGADALSLIAAAARHCIDITSLPVVAARLR